MALRNRTGTPRQTGGQASETNYCPDEGDIIWIDFDPTKGSEQQGRRPALVLSARSYNERVELCVVCPITSRAKGYPFEVALPQGHQVTGVVLADHLRNLSWSQRRAKFFGHAPPEILDDARAKIAALIGLD
jgi:mRNA interferase MazF